MHAKKLRAEAEKRRTFTDQAWKFLEQQGYVEDALTREFDKDQVTEIVKAIDYFKVMWGADKSGEASSEGTEGRTDTSETRSAPLTVYLTDVEHERALLLTDAQVRAASADPWVRDFRERYLPEGLLKPEEAELFLEQSPQAIETLGSFLHKYYGWHKGEAKWWALTGEAPSSRPVRVSLREAHSLGAPSVYLITIETPPWIAAETVQGVFSEMRRRMRIERKPPDARSVRVTRFVESLQSSPATKDLTFKEMHRRWNEEHPDETFSKYRTFERAYKRTVAILRREYNTDIEREETPELRRQYARGAKRGRAHSQTVREAAHGLRKVNPPPPARSAPFEPLRPAQHGP
jgi:hypothetical protein